MAYYPYYPTSYHYSPNWSQSGTPPTSAPPSSGPPGAIQFGSFPPTPVDTVPYSHHAMYYPYMPVMPYGYPPMTPQQPGGQPPHGVPPRDRSQPRHDRNKPRPRMGAPHRDRPDSRNSHREHHEAKEQPSSRSETPTQTHKEPPNYPPASAGYVPPNHSAPMTMHPHPHAQYPMGYYYQPYAYMAPPETMQEVGPQYHQKPRIALEPNTTPAQGATQTQESGNAMPQPSPTPTGASKRRLQFVNPNTHIPLDDVSASQHVIQAERRISVSRVESHHSSKPSSPRNSVMTEIDKCVSEVMSDTGLERSTSTKVKSRVGKTELKTEETISKKPAGRYPVQSGQPKFIDPSNGKFIPSTYRSSVTRLQESPVVLSKAKESISIADDVLKTVESVERRVEAQQSVEKVSESEMPEKIEKKPVTLILDPSKGSTKGTAEAVSVSRVVPVKTEVIDRPASHPVVISVGTPQTESVTSKEEFEATKTEEPEQKAEVEMESETMEPKADSPSKNVYSPRAMQEFKEKNKEALPDITTGPWTEGTELEPPSPAKETLGRRGSATKSGSRGLSRRNSSIRSRQSKSDPEDVFHISSKNRMYTMDFMQSLRDRYTEKPQFQESLLCMRDVDGPALRRHPSDKWLNKKGIGFDGKASIGRSPSGKEWKNEPGRGSGKNFRGINRQASNRSPEDSKWGKTDINLLSPFAPDSVGSGLRHSENRYVVGEIRSDDPEEEKRQKTFKGLLNKLTPSNFARMYEKFKEVEIRDPKTLKGLIDQIFDKALTETTFCPLYSDLCKLLTTEMPEFEEEGDKRKLTFRRLLLNKCQNEFEKGDAAVRAAEEAEAADPADMSAEERQNRLIEAKKERIRSLGNMQFIGFLFKKGMLTERIIHNCIVDLLREEQNPKPEDIECLCKLVSTVGEVLPKQEVVNAYFVRIDRLSKNPKLETRHKFMLLDLIELKAREWVARREKEGPKKIEEIHRDAQMEQMAQNARNRTGYGGNYMGRNSRNTTWSRSTTTASRPPSTFNAHEEVKPLTRNLSLGRTASQDISLRPGTIGKGTAVVSMPMPRSRSPQQTTQPTPIQETKDEESKAQSMDLGTINKKVKGLLAEYYEVKDMEEALQCISELISDNAEKSEILKSIMLSALDIRGVGAEDRLKPIAPLLKEMLARKIYVPTDVKKGLQMTMMAVPEVVDDFPRAPTLIGRMFGSLVSDEIIPLRTMLDANGIILGAGRKELQSEEDDTPLVDCNSASQILVEMLRQMKSEEKEERYVRDAVNKENADLLLFYPSYQREDIDLTYELNFLD